MDASGRRRGIYRRMVEPRAQAGRFETEKPFLRGGIWPNFLSRYPESNWMHKRMLALSARLAACPESAGSADLRGLLYAAQANDAYWHGLFGGVYLPHLRRGVWSSLIALERALDRLQPRAASSCVDLDHDGVDELFLRSGELQAVIKLDGRAAVCELDAYALAQNFGDTLRRHAEHYHGRVMKTQDVQPGGGGIASAHERERLKHPIEASELAPDAEPQYLLRDTWRAADGAAQVIDCYVPGNTAPDAAQVSFSAALGELRLEKTIAVEGNALSARYRLALSGKGELRTVLSLAMPSCDGYGGRCMHRGEILGGFGQEFDLSPVAEFVLDDRHMQGGIKLSIDPPARLAGRPYHTVSQSEDGFERIMQCVVIEVV